MPISDLTSRESVLKAIAEYDKLDRKGFLDKYGFGEARNYLLWHDGRPYDSKAIAGVAYGIQYPRRGTYPAARFTGGLESTVPTLKKLGFDVRSGTNQILEAGRTYSWKELGKRFGFVPAYLNRVGGMAPRPEHGCVLLVTHPGGAKSFNYADYWDGDDLIYTGRGLDNDQQLQGANRDVAENRRRLLLFEAAGAERWLYLGDVECQRYWRAMAPDRSGKDRRIYKFRLVPLERHDTSKARKKTRQASRQSGSRQRGTFRPRPFDASRTPPRRRRGNVKDPDRRHVLAEQADKGHQATLRKIGLWLEDQGWKGLEEYDGAMDLVATSPARPKKRRTFFEVKTITRTSERERVRGALAQLLEYRFFHGNKDVELCMVTNAPISDRRLRLLDELGIAHIYVERGKVRVSATAAAKQVFNL